MVKRVPAKVKAQKMPFVKNDFKSRSMPKSWREKQKTWIFDGLRALRAPLAACLQLM